jgi:hypothetical protein
MGSSSGTIGRADNKENVVKINLKMKQFEDLKMISFPENYIFLEFLPFSNRHIFKFSNKN